MKLDKTKKILIIVESPNKRATVSEIFKSLGYEKAIVMASVGHITQIADSGLYNMGIDVKKDFKADYRVMDGKKDIVQKLSEQVKSAEAVILMTDGDREGEAIAWHLFDVLKIPKYKCFRATTHEITKPAIEKCLNDLRDIDYDLVAAADSRAKRDKIVGYRLSSIARSNVGAKSVGRCQSPGLGLVVDLEEQITNFNSETYYDLFLKFSKNKVDFKAKYQSKNRLSTLDECNKIIASCIPNNYIISDIQKKDIIENPKLPFTTSTFQQEVCKKLNLSVKDAMACAQKLFEGIEIAGHHTSTITYIRTDDSSISPEFLETIKEYVINKYGENYYSPLRQQKKKENDTSQEAHEAIRAVDLNMTPKALSQYINNPRLIQVYEIIWKRTIASCMKPAIFANTAYTIENNNNKFLLNSKELRFDGYRKVYEYGKEDNDSDDSEFIKESFNVDEKLENTKLITEEKNTSPPSRYDEASFVKELDRRGIGRPSTYASILQTILDESRGYTKIQDKKIIPTDLGIKLWEYLKKNFSETVSIESTANMEKELDLIATGKRDALDSIKDFYSKLCNDIEKVSPEIEDKKCPTCGKKMLIRYNKANHSKFWGCSGYPDCKCAFPLNNAANISNNKN